MLATLRKWRGWILLAGLGASACGHAGAELTRETAFAVSSTALGPNDVFEVRVYGEADLASGTYRVASDGTINYPLVGSIDVDGKSASQIRTIITKGLERYIKEPSVSVFIKERSSKKVYVFGRVQKAGTFPFEDGMNIIQAITLAGGFGQMANENVAYVTRIVDGQEQQLEVSIKDIGAGKSPNFRLEPGDIVMVPESWY